jgi:hypothetical protein
MKCIMHGTRKPNLIQHMTLNIHIANLFQVDT